MIKNERYFATKEMKTMRQYLQELRLNKGYTQRYVAHEVGITPQYYLKIEKGERGNKMSFLIGCKLAEVFDVELDEFYQAELEYQLEQDREWW